MRWKNSPLSFQEVLGGHRGGVTAPWLSRKDMEVHGVGSHHLYFAGNTWRSSGWSNSTVTFQERPGGPWGGVIAPWLSRKYLEAHRVEVTHKGVHNYIVSEGAVFKFGLFTILLSTYLWIQRLHLTLPSGQAVWETDDDLWDLFFLISLYLQKVKTTWFGHKRDICLFCRCCWWWQEHSCQESNVWWVAKWSKFGDMKPGGVAPTHHLSIQDL